MTNEPIKVALLVRVSSDSDRQDYNGLAGAFVQKVTVSNTFTL